MSQRIIPRVVAGRADEDEKRKGAARLLVQIMKQVRTSKAERCSSPDGAQIIPCPGVVS